MSRSRLAMRVWSEFYVVLIIHSNLMYYVLQHLSNLVLGYFLEQHHVKNF